ncbi:18749_t:CDS:2 [Gigaspora margarita]|uniref:18749_t:CDS:1 n=1 Tax=Gigaspora margarita TaxID=4874 RepID=A0ABM8W297_GIGMA|nr:18749_t:CDS:2 [Gigaspora margarita]
MSKIVKLKSKVTIENYVTESQRCFQSYSTESQKFTKVNILFESLPDPL